MRHCRIFKRRVNSRKSHWIRFVAEVVFNLSTTARILGGCPMGQDPNDGVIDKHGQLFGYENFYVADGSIIPVNLSVNPSLTILALSEWIMSHVTPNQLDSPAVDQGSEGRADLER